MTTLQFFLSMLLICGFVLLCYFRHATATGVETSIGVHKSIKCIDHERDALLQFKQGTKDYCEMLTSWGKQEDCCLWHGIRCNNLTGHVIALHLRGKEANICLEGKVVTSLFELKHLIYMDLSLTSIHHTIPKSIGSLINLKHLNLSNAGFHGEIPPQLGNLSNLVYLDLSNSNNGFQDNLTTKRLHWLSNLTSLREINLSGIDLSKVVDWFKTTIKIKSLRVLYLEACDLPPIIPSSLSYINSSTTLRVINLSFNMFNDTSIFQWLFDLSRAGHQFEYLDLSYNSLPGPLPSGFGNMHSLTYLSLSNNNLEGPIPDIFSSMRSLRVLSLSYNNFHGPISKVLSKLSCCLEDIDLSSNKLSDDLSNVLKTLSEGCSNKPVLEYLDLSENRLWGSISDIISTFSSLRTMFMNGNELDGTISQGLGKLSMLENLDISNNSLEATLNHSHFLNLSRLRKLYLFDNPSLVFKVNPDWIPPFQLDILSLRSCKLGPTFPMWLLTQTNLSYLDISNTQLSGNIPQSFWVESLSPNLQYLNISHNMIQGVLPNMSTAFDVLSELDLSSNYFQGSIPSSLGLYVSSLYLNNNMFTDATHLLCPNTPYTVFENIDLSNNLLSGELPNCWMQLNGLSSLHLENNQFFGNIPPSFGSLKQLQFLHLENNSLSGELPASFQHCSSLVILDLGYNSLTGYIPSSLGNFVSELGILNLRGNKFFGKLPISLCQLSKLQILDVASNHISGMIPNCIQNLTAMTIDQLDYLTYAISGTGLDRMSIETLPETAAIEWKRELRMFGDSLGLVKTIDLSYNELEGKIANGMSNLTGLKSLDLSKNKLSGSIPRDIGQLTSLEFLDLSNNQLSGNIPTSLAQVSGLGTLDLSNNKLSGKIPLGTQLQGFDPSSYEGNTLLCGMPLQECSGDNPPASTINGENNITQHEHEDSGIYPGLYISVVLGFIFGFWGVCGTLVVKRSWRVAFFQFFDDMKDKLYVIAIVNVSKVWKSS